jgi:hypothetical protein
VCNSLINARINAQKLDRQPRSGSNGCHENALCNKRRQRWQKNTTQKLEKPVHAQDAIAAIVKERGAYPPAPKTPET